MEQVTIHEAKTHLSRLIAKVSRGYTIIIKKGTRPVAQLMPLPQKVEHRIFGTEVGKITITSDFDEMPEIFTRHFKK